MKIGDRIFVRGYIDEIRKDTVIVRNDGGYFGTVLSEVTGELPSVQPEPHWIPMSERPPKVREWVLCQCRAGIMDVLRLTEDGYWNKSYPHAEYMSGFVIAWMPLPEPYKEEQE